MKKVTKSLIVVCFLIGTIFTVTSLSSRESLDIRNKASEQDCPTGKKCVVLVVGKVVYGQIKPSLDLYIQDVESTSDVKILLANTDSYETFTPEQIRALLIDYHTNKNIQGALLVGRIPYALWENGWDDNKGVNSFFYEDLDGNWLDNDSDGYYDYHTWGVNDGPEIWVSWIYPSDVSGTQNMKDLNYFFSKTHSYYTGNLTANKKSFIMLHSDWARDMDFYYEKFSDIYGNDVETRGGYDTSGNPIEVDGNDYLSHIRNSYQMTLIYVHGSNNTHYPNINYINKEDLEVTGGGSMITFIGGCHTGDLLASGKDIPIAETYLFRMPTGLVSTATTWSYGPEELQEVTRELKNNNTFADAWFIKQRYRNNSAFYKKRYGETFDPNTHMFGEILFGNPLFKLNEDVCKPDCAGKTCGDSDGCSGLCESCPDGQVCDTSSWTCTQICVPSCTGKECGSDGCGGSCGTCTGEETCLPSGTCQKSCTPDCEGKECGNDGCGGSCGTCDTNESCSTDSKCKPSGDSCSASDIWGKYKKPDGKVNSYDLSKLLANWKWQKTPRYEDADIWGPLSDSDGEVNGYDLSKLLGCFETH
ncbi:MAG: hypothetical protein PHS44_03795 [Candidatus Dojkabacteria bacterium]|nr:hypothetical protein [Candidatus Dojkabacteria bacterium]